MRFQNICFMFLLLHFLVVALRVELSTTRLSAEFGQPALDYPLAISRSFPICCRTRVAHPEQRKAWRTARHALVVLRDVPPSTNVSLHYVGTAGLEPAILCSQNTWVRRYPTSRYRSQSERADLNRRSPGPQPDAIPGFATFCFFRSPYRSRTGPFAAKRRCPRTDRRTGPSRRIFSTQLTQGVARTFYAVGRAVLESASPGFQPGATPSQLPTQKNQQKNPMSL
jgi:hypothetical protein